MTNPTVAGVLPPALGGMPGWSVAGSARCTPPPRFMRWLTWPYW